MNRILSGELGKQQVELYYTYPIIKNIMGLDWQFMRKNNNAERTTSYIKHLAISGLSSISARIKSTCNLTGKCFEMPNVSYT